MTPMEQQLQTALERLHSDFGQRLKDFERREAALQSICADLRLELSNTEMRWRALTEQVTALSERIIFLTRLVDDSKR